MTPYLRLGTETWIFRKGKLGCFLDNRYIVWIPGNPTTSYKDKFKFRLLNRLYTGQYTEDEIQQMIVLKRLDIHD